VVEEGNWLVRFFKALYTPLLAWALRFKLVVVAAAVVLFGSSLFVFTRLGAEFIPQLDEGTMLLQFIRSSSAGLNASTDLQRKSRSCCWRSSRKSNACSDSSHCRNRR